MITERFGCDACGKAGRCKVKADFTELDEAAGYLTMRLRGVIERLADWAAPCPWRPSEEEPKE